MPYLIGQKLCDWSYQALAEDLPSPGAKLFDFKAIEQQ